jgi:hypothetical protein
MVGWLDVRDTRTQEKLEVDGMVGQERLNIEYAPSLQNISNEPSCTCSRCVFAWHVLQASQRRRVESEGGRVRGERRNKRRQAGDVTGRCPPSFCFDARVVPALLCRLDELLHEIAVPAL